MTGVDIAILAWVALCGLWIAWTGALRAFFGVVTLVLAGWWSVNYAAHVDAFITPYWEPPIPLLFGGLLILVAVLVLGMVLLQALMMVQARLGLSWLDYMLGMVLGGLLGFVTTWFLLAGLRWSPLVPAAPQQAWWRESTLIPVLVKYGDTLWEKGTEKIINHSKRR